MADITFTVKATERHTDLGLAGGKGEAANLKISAFSVELTAQSQAATIKLGRPLPSNARLSSKSTIYWDDLATTGSPTLDIGIAAVGGNITDDPDAINDGLDIAATSSAANRLVIKDYANLGKRLWEYGGVTTSDPKGLIQIYGTIADADTTATGTLAGEFHYYID